ncbi:MAG: hypothetical protein Q4B29_01565 [Candidatus Saccharibacteria bacterium]|nr:hypothetical protein [Candidatus Saccharibacteria bacterium]
MERKRRSNISKKASWRAWAGAVLGCCLLFVNTSMAIYAIIHCVQSKSNCMDRICSCIGVEQGAYLVANFLLPVNLLALTFSVNSIKAYKRRVRLKNNLVLGVIGICSSVASYFIPLIVGSFL